jgi:Beta protein
MSLKFNHGHYVPILKGKQGELDAIRETAPEIRGDFTPLVEVPPVPPKYIEGEDEPVPGKTIDLHVSDVSQKFTDALGANTPVFIDGYYIENEGELGNGEEPVTGIFEGLRKSGVRFIPTIGLDRVSEYTEAVREAIQEDRRGCCLRLVEPDLEGLSELETQVASLMDALEVDAGAVDLIVDFGPNVPSRAALPYQINALPLLKKWRTLTVASSSFPVNMEDVAQNSVVEFERREWTAWNFLRSKPKTLARMPTFGDYAINHPSLTDIDPRIMRMSPNIRYTSAVNYVIAKGQAYPRKKDPRKKTGVAASEQYPRLAEMVMKHPSWAGKKFSWGDGFIDACARKARVGNPTNWRAVGTCHHIASVVRQIASLP